MGKLPKVGDVMYVTTEPADTQPKQVETFNALVFVQDHPGQLKASNEKENKGKTEHVGGFTPPIHVRTAKAPCQIRSIKWKIGKKTEVVMAPRMPFVCAPYSECKALGRMAAMDSNNLIMLGKITEVVWKAAK